VLLTASLRFDGDLRRRTEADVDASFDRVSLAASGSGMTPSSTSLRRDEGALDDVDVDAVGRASFASFL
jgi:hypothetical protein